MKIEIGIFCMERICTIMLHHYGQYILVDILILWNLHTQVNIISNRIWLLLLHWYGNELQLSHLRPTDHCKVVLQTYFFPLLHEGNLTTSALKHPWFAILQAWSLGCLPANFIRIFEDISKVIAGDSSFSKWSRYGFCSFWVLFYAIIQQHFLFCFTFPIFVDCVSVLNMFVPHLHPTWYKSKNTLHDDSAMMHLRHLMAM